MPPGLAPISSPRPRVSHPDSRAPSALVPALTPAGARSSQEPGHSPATGPRAPLLLEVRPSLRARTLATHPGHAALPVLLREAGLVRDGHRVMARSCARIRSFPRGPHETKPRRGQTAPTPGRGPPPPWRALRAAPLYFFSQTARFRSWKLGRKDLCARQEFEHKHPGTYKNSDSQPASWFIK